MNVQLTNTLRVLYYGWKESGKISKKSNVNKSQLSIYLDMISCFKKYQTIHSQYSNYEMYKLSDAEKNDVGNQLKEKNKQRDEWEKVYFKNIKFLNKWTKLKWEKSSLQRNKRKKAYTKYFGLGKNCTVQYNVKFICEHNSVGELKVGENVLLARGCDIDYTGDLVIGNGVAISEGVKILTHSHDVFHSKDESELIPFSNRAFATPLEIGDNARIGAHAIIMPGVSSIGECAFISAGAVVTKSVPPRVVVAGNPAQTVVKIPKKVNIVERF